MITLITGAPGAGKSAALVSLLSELSKGRAIYASGIPELAIPHFDLDQLFEDAYPVDHPARVAYKLQAGKECQGPNLWPELVPDGSLVVIDEVQRVWRPRGPGSKVPLDIAALETHRHRGLDFYIITQAPRLVDSNVRGLVGRHVHLREIGILGRWWYEWPECAEQCSNTWKSAPIKKRYRLDKSVFSKYKSASVHIKPIRSLPWMLVVLVVALALAGFLVWRSYKVITSKISPLPDLHQPGAPGQPGASGIESVQRRGVGSGPAPYDVTIFTPRISSKPESAPAYDSLRVVAAVPFVTNGYCDGDLCRCFTDQATDAGLSNSDCSAFVKRPPFNPYRVRPIEAAPSRSQAGGATGGPGAPPNV